MDALARIAFRNNVRAGRVSRRFCRDRGLPLWQFYEWKKRLREDFVTFTA